MFITKQSDYSARFAWTARLDVRAGVRGEAGGCQMCSLEKTSRVPEAA